MLRSSDTLHKMNMQTWFFERKVISYANLISIEARLHNFSAASQIYKSHIESGNIKMKMEILSDIFPSLQLQYHEALLRQGKGSIDTFISLSKLRITQSHSMNYDHNLEIDLRRSADILRTAKHFDAAIDLGKALKELTGDNLSLATTYLEQFIFGDEKFLPVEFGFDLAHLFQEHKNDDFNIANAATMLVLAQSTYLFHQFLDNQVVVIGYIEKYLDCISNVQSYCITCMQTATDSEVQFVCSGCRVACYCSIDHQRMSWKKEAFRGMHFGHEVLCPVMKAYRKWRHANDNGDNERVSRLRRRFERECLYCLSDGMGLKDKCFK